MAQKLEQISDEQVWIPVGQNFEYLVEIDDQKVIDVLAENIAGLSEGLRKTSDNVRASLARMTEQDKYCKYGVK